VGLIVVAARAGEGDPVRRGVVALQEAHGVIEAEDASEGFGWQPEAVAEPRDQVPVAPPDFGSERGDVESPVRGV